MLKKYGKRRTDGSAQVMKTEGYRPSYTFTDSDAEFYEAVATHDGFLEMVYTPKPAYDPETEYLVETWEVVGDKLAQTWTIKQYDPEPEPETEEKE